MDSTSRAIPELTKKTGMKNPYSRRRASRPFRCRHRLRWDNWKFVFLEQRAYGSIQIWMEPYTELRVPKIFNLRTDPYERADITSNTYFDWLLERAWTLVPAQTYVAQMAQSLIEFPPSQSPASFTINQVMATLQAGMTSA